MVDTRVGILLALLSDLKEGDSSSGLRSPFLLLHLVSNTVTLFYGSQDTLSPTRGPN